jgi:flagellar assembly factor FliW
VGQAEEVNQEPVVKIETTRFGPLDIDETTIIRIPGGLIGFPEHERFILLRHNPESPFYWFQSVDQSDLAFVIVDPHVFKPDYRIPLNQSVLAMMNAGSDQEISTFVIVTIPRGNPQGMTANLLGPLVINTGSRLAKQLVLDDRQYSHRHPIMSPPGREVGREKNR